MPLALARGLDTGSETVLHTEARIGLFGSGVEQDPMGRWMDGYLEKLAANRRENLEGGGVIQIHGRRAMVYATDFTVMSGSLGDQGVWKIARPGDGATHP